MEKTTSTNSTSSSALTGPDQNLQASDLAKSQLWPDSWCVTHWQAPEPELLVWKKSTLTEAMVNLTQMKDFLSQESLWQQCYFQVSKEKLVQSLAKNGNFKELDYVYLVDIEAQKILVENQNGQQVLLGGDRETSKSGLETLRGKIGEKTAAQLQLEVSKFLKIGEFKKSLKLNKNKPKNGDNSDGQHLNIYFYPLKMTKVDLENVNKKLLLHENSENQTENMEKSLANQDIVFLEWVDLNYFINKNSFINWPIWSNFCAENQLFCPDLPLEIWHQQALLSFWRTGNLELWAISSMAFWETQIKTWLNENSKKTGDYLWPLRVALSGQKQSPSPFELLACLSPAQVQERLNQVLTLSSKNQIN